MSSKLIQDSFKKKVVSAYITLGDPSINATLEYCQTAFKNGIDMIELGIPFSDPIADGPVIQASHQRALSTGEDVSINAAFTLIKQLKTEFPSQPVLIMAATNLVLQYGLEQCMKNAKKAGCDGFVLPDCPIEMATPYTHVAAAHNIDFIQLMSPLCTQKRLESIVKAATGFIYVISSTGITGERAEFSKELSSLIKRIKAIKNTPVSIGFGVNSPTQIKALHKIADGVIIGSHFTKLLHNHPKNIKNACKALKTRLGELIS